jgi:hypothetical protein
MEGAIPRLVARSCVACHAPGRPVSGGPMKAQFGSDSPQSGIPIINPRRHPQDWPRSLRSEAISHDPRSAATTMLGALHLRHHHLSLCPSVGSSPRVSTSTEWLQLSPTCHRSINRGTTTPLLTRRAAKPVPGSALVLRHVAHRRSIESERLASKLSTASLSYPRRADRNVAR